jgi:predicted Zn-dependent protease
MRTCSYVVVLCWAGCAHQLPPASAGQLDALSARLEQRMSRRLRPLRDPDLQRFVQVVGERVAGPASSGRPVPLRFVIVDDPVQANVFTVGGRTIYIDSGAVALAHSEAELAALLAHQVAHLARGDTVEILAQSYGRSRLLRAAAGQDDRLLDDIAMQVDTSGAVTVTPPTMERDADAAALQYLVATGYDPHSLVEVLRTFARVWRQRPQVVATFYKSHPPFRDRELRLVAAIRGMGDPHGYSGSINMAGAMRRLRGYYARLGLSVG